MAKLKGTSSLPRKEKRKAHKLAAKEKKQQRHASRATAALQASSSKLLSLSSRAIQYIGGVDKCPDWVRPRACSRLTQHCCRCSVALPPFFSTSLSPCLCPPPPYTCMDTCSLHMTLALLSSFTHYTHCCTDVGLPRRQSYYRNYCSSGYRGERYRNKSTKTLHDHNAQ